MNLQSKLCAFALSIASTGALACTGVENPNVLVSKLTATSTSINFSGRNNAWVATLGTIKNSSAACVKNIVVEVKYRDSEGKQIDVVNQTLEDVVVGPGQEVAFRAKDIADKPQESYASSTVRVVSAEPKYIAEPKEKDSLLVSLIANWGPMLLLIGSYVWLMRSYLGKKSPQYQTLELVKQQVALLTRHVDALERVAVAAEKRAPDIR